MRADSFAGRIVGALARSSSPETAPVSPWAIVTDDLPRLNGHRSGYDQHDQEEQDQHDPESS